MVNLSFVSHLVLFHRKYLSTEFVAEELDMKTLYRKEKFSFILYSDVFPGEEEDLRRAGKCWW